MSAFKESFDRLYEAGTFSMIVNVSSPVRGNNGVQIQAWVDDRRKALKSSVFQSGRSYEVVRLGDDLFVQVEAGEWLRVDLGRLDPAAPLVQNIDITSFSGVLGGLVSATHSGDQVGGPYTGVVDLRRAVEAAPASHRPAIEQVLDLATNANALPIRGTLDDAGRLKELNYTVETAAGDVKTQIRADDFGEPVEIAAPPAAQVKQAAAEFYELVGA
ncbi:hypothetical protein DFJ67_7585 [Asanoa ferruginea]|uniref:Uncharacterized protein n=1 Tax=Asanoa ferruginea TaxID=53367 RepID=A0A3E0A540_9ACTN|nr:hypothetical protein DFJ67_7585 [Asanoa ferruginea]